MDSRCWSVKLVVFKWRFVEYCWWSDQPLYCTVQDVIVRLLKSNSLVRGACEDGQEKHEQ